MNVISFTDASARLDEVMEQVVRDHAPVAVRRVQGGDVVIAPLSEWRAMEETIHLLSSAENAARLREGIAQLDAGQGTERTLAS